MNEISSLTVWLRLEPRCQTADWQESLRASIHDPLWMMGRSRQLGELRGSDGGYPSIAELSAATGETMRCALQGDVPAAESALTGPLEMTVESIPVDEAGDYLLRVRLGAECERHIPNQKLLATLHAACSLQLPKNPAVPDDTLAFFDALGGPIVDVLPLRAAFSASRASQPEKLRALVGRALTEEETDLLRDAIAKLEDWVGRLADQPSGSAWVSEQMGYRFSISTEVGGMQPTLVAQDYHEGEPDWHTYDLKASPNKEGGLITTTWSIPAPVRYPGMPNERWWYMEDARVDFGSVRPETTDLGRLAALGFAVSASNDWFVIPLRSARETLTRVTGLRVIDSFGRGQDYTTAEDRYPAWTMFSLSKSADGTRQSNLLYVPGSPSLRLDGPFVEEVALVRDETLNVVFGVERRVRDSVGGSVGASEWAARLQAEALERYRVDAQKVVDLWNAESQLGKVSPEAQDAAVQGIRQFLRAGGQRTDLKGGPKALPGDALPGPEFRLAKWAPPNWIPFLPVTGEQRLLRHALPQMDAKTGGWTRIDAKGRILKPDRANTAPFYIGRATVPRIGARVVENAQMRRGRDGRIHFWYGRSRAPGNGEASSGIHFDFLDNVTSRA
jgi:hypothetical protein